jgi:hypothetical protein
MRSNVAIDELCLPSVYRFRCGHANQSVSRTEDELTEPCKADPLRLILCQEWNDDRDCSLNLTSHVASE